jgi:hypothetical protein
MRYQVVQLHSFEVICELNSKFILEVDWQIYSFIFRDLECALVSPSWDGVDRLYHHVNWGKKAIFNYSYGLSA